MAALRLSMLQPGSFVVGAQRSEVADQVAGVVRESLAGVKLQAVRVHVSNGGKHGGELLVAQHAVEEDAVNRHEPDQRALADGDIMTAVLLEKGLIVASEERFRRAVGNVRKVLLRPGGKDGEHDK